MLTTLPTRSSPAELQDEGDLVFRRWVRLTVAELSPEILKARWDAVTAAARELSTVEDDVALVRLASTIPPSRHEAHARDVLERSGAACDLNWPDGEKPLLMAMLASGVLAHRLRDPRDGSHELLALAILVARSGGLRTGDFLDDLAIMAERYCGVRAIAERGGAWLATPNRTSESISYADLADEDDADSDDDNEEGESDETIALLREKVHRLEAALSVQQEQLDLAWLLLTEALPSGEPVASVDAASLPIRVGFELGQLSQRRVGPPGALAVLRRILLQNAEVQCDQAVLLSTSMGAPDVPERRAWDDLAASVYDLVRGLAPISTAIRLSWEAPDGSWHSAFEHATGLDLGTAALTPIALAQQAMSETLLVRALVDGNSKATAAPAR